MINAIAIVVDHLIGITRIVEFGVSIGASYLRSHVGDQRKASNGVTIFVTNRIIGSSLRLIDVMNDEPATSNLNGSTLIAAQCFNVIGCLIDVSIAADCI